ncbi:Hypothetical protein (plasmid) [Pseudomonas putida]|jgi:hypothetical protein|nr:Hypothetical protein [Pseudomonas putida]
MCIPLCLAGGAGSFRSDLFMIERATSPEIPNLGGELIDSMGMAAEG